MSKKTAKPGQQQKPSSAFVWSSIAAGMLFYGLLISASKWFPMLTGRAIENEWILVLISAIPMIVVLVLFLSNRITEVNIAGIGLKFKNELPESVLETIDLDEQILGAYLEKGSPLFLNYILQSIKLRSSLPTILLVPIEEKYIEFELLRKYIYTLADASPIRYIVFVGREKQYLGYTTYEKFKLRFPRVTLEFMAEAIRGQSFNNAFNRNIDDGELASIENFVNRIIQEQWRSTNRENDENRVTALNLGRFGFSDQKIRISTNPTIVYRKLLENDLDGLPVVDKEGKFVGVVTRDRISQAVILQLMQKSDKLESAE
jgi:hypothetical protein